MSSSKACSKCITVFECKADETGCWCEAFTISTDNLRELKTSFADCLCPACLKEYAAAETPE
jgi:hypothetical protein